MSMKNFTDTTGNRTRDLPAAPPRDLGWQVSTEIPEEISAIVFRVFQEFPQRTLHVAA
jgi:hypothetical protein